MGECETLVGPPRPDDTETGPLTIGAILADVADRFASHEAIVFDDPLLGGETVRWTYTDLHREARRVAGSLVDLGIGKGARIGLLMSNRPEAVATLFGAALVGAVAVPFSTFSSKPELAFLLAHADVSVLFLQATMDRRSFAADVVDLCPGAASAGTILDSAYPYLRTAVAVGPAQDAAGIGSWEAFLERGAAIDDHLLDAMASQVDPSDLGVVIYSSGTTDRPKGVLHNQRSVALQWRMQADLFGRDEHTRVWCPLPLFWTAGMNTAMGATLAAGACWVTQERFDPGEALALLARERVTEPHMLPHQGRTLEEHLDWADSDLSSCTRVFGKSIFNRHPTVEGDPSWNMPVGYGSSETCSMFTALPWTTPRDVLRKGSYGRLLPGNELRVLDPETGRALGANQEGELVLRGPTLMEHYVKRSRDECFDDDGWYRTGDLGSYDDDGLVYFSGRRTEMIKTSGANVSPAEIEVQLQAHDALTLARVVGVPDERRDEIVVLCVERKEGATVDEDDLKQFLRDRLAAYKVPRHVLFFDEGTIPMISNRTKVDTDALRRAAGARLAGSAS